MLDHKIKLAQLFSTALLASVVAVGCADYSPGGARSRADAEALALKLRTECTPAGIGIEGVHNGGLRKSEIFKCNDGTIGFIPYGYKR